MKYNNVLRGRSVEVKNDDVNKALRKFKNKVQESGILQDLKEREHYVSKANKLRRAKSAGRMRWLKRLEAESLPKKLY